MRHQRTVAAASRTGLEFPRVGDRREHGRRVISRVDQAGPVTVCRAVPVELPPPTLLVRGGRRPERAELVQSAGQEHLFKLINRVVRSRERERSIVVSKELELKVEKEASAVRVSRPMQARNLALPRSLRTSSCTSSTAGPCARCRLVVKLLLGDTLLILPTRKHVKAARVSLPPLCSPSLHHVSRI